MALIMTDYHTSLLGARSTTMCAAKMIVFVRHNILQSIQACGFTIYLCEVILFMPVKDLVTSKALTILATQWYANRKIKLWIARSDPNGLANTPANVRGKERKSIPVDDCSQLSLSHWSRLLAQCQTKFNILGCPILFDQAQILVET